MFENAEQKFLGCSYGGFLYLPGQEKQLLSINTQMVKGPGTNGIAEYHGCTFYINDYKKRNKQPRLLVKQERIIYKDPPL